jgi:two-component system response regulator HydG
MQRLIDYSWPGNVRELQNTIERAVVLTKALILDEADLPEHISDQQRDAEVLTVPIGMPLDELERRVIRETLLFTDGDKKRAAQLLGIATRTIYRKLDSN